MTHHNRQWAFIVAIYAACAAPPLKSQVSFGGEVATPAAIVDFGNAGQTIPARKLASDPSTCTVGEQYFNTTSNFLKVCSTANTWTSYAPTGGSVTSVGLSAVNTVFATSGSPVTGSGTLTLTPSGSSGGVPYFSGASSMASSASLSANAVVVGGGAGAAPKTTGVTINTSGDLLTDGAVVTGASGSSHGKLTLGELPANGSATVGWEAPDLITNILSLVFPDATPSANNIMVFPAPTGGQSQFAWRTFSSTNLTDASNLVRTNQGNTYSTGDQNFSSAASLEVPVTSGLTATINGRIGYDSTGNQLHAAINSVDAIIPTRGASAPVSGNCAKWSANGQLADQGSACGGAGSTLRDSQAPQAASTTGTGSDQQVYATSLTASLIGAGKCLTVSFGLGTGGSGTVTAWLELGGSKVTALNVAPGATYAETWKVCNNPAVQDAQWVILSGASVSASGAGMSSPAGTYAIDLTQASTISLNVNAAATGTWKGLGWSVELAQ